MPISNLSNGLRTGVCTSTNRPTTPYEGQVIYETDTDKVFVWNASAWKQVPTAATAGAVLQVVQGVTSTAVTNSTTTVADTGLTATITPQYNTSKILVLVSQAGCEKTVTNSQSAINLYLYRGASLIQQFGYAGLYTNTTLESIGNISTVYLDSPATTSSTTYKTQFANLVAASLVAVQVNSVPQSTITLMEISA